jgi:hypothetical protein
MLAQQPLPNSLLSVSMNAFNNKWLTFAWTAPELRTSAPDVTVEVLESA